MSNGKRDIGHTLKTIGTLFFGTDKQAAETREALAKDVAKTVKRVRARDGAINALGETVEDDAQTDAKERDQ